MVGPVPLWLWPAAPKCKGQRFAQSGTVAMLPREGYCKHSAHGAGRKTVAKKTVPHTKRVTLLVWGTDGVFSCKWSMGKAYKTGGAKMPPGGNCRRGAQNADQSRGTALLGTARKGCTGIGTGMALIRPAAERSAATALFSRFGTGVLSAQWRVCRRPRRAVRHRGSR